MAIGAGIAITTAVLSGGTVPLAVATGTAAGSAATAATVSTATATVAASVGAAATGTAAVSTSAATGTVAVAGFFGSSSVAGAIIGAETTGTVAGTGLGALLAGSSAAGTGGIGAGMASLVAGPVVASCFWLLLVGTSVTSEEGDTTFDCWKPVVHDLSKEQSSGMLMKDLVCHPNVAKVTMTTGICTELPNIVIENIWNETFEIHYMFLHATQKIACHAKPVHQ